MGKSGFALEGEHLFVHCGLETSCAKHNKSAEEPNHSPAWGKAGCAGRVLSAHRDETPAQAMRDVSGCRLLGHAVLTGDSTAFSSHS